MIKDLLIVNRFMSLPAALSLFILSLRGILFFIYLEEIECYDLMQFLGSILYLLSSILLFLDFENLNIVLVKKKIWLLLLFIGLAMRNVA